MFIMAFNYFNVIHECLMWHMRLLLWCKVVYLKWWPLLRDCVFYTFSIILLVLSILDEAIYWYLRLCAVSIANCTVSSKILNLAN